VTAYKGSQFDSDEKSNQNGVIWLDEDSCNFLIRMKNRSDEKNLKILT
jgi:hypothetical protein